MPKVPYGLPDVQNAPIGNARQESYASEEAFGGGVAKGLQILGRGLAQVGSDAAEIKNIDDQREAENREMAYQNYLRESLVGTPDKPGFYSLQGQDAVDALPALQKEMADQRAKIGDGMNGNARRQYDQRTSPLLNNHLERTGEYGIKARDEANLATWVQQGKEADTHAAAFARDDRELQGALNQKDDATNKIMDLHGIRDPKTRAGMLADARSETITSAIASLISTGDDDAAQSLFDRTKNVLSEKDRIAVQTHLQDSTLTTFAQGAVDHVYGLSAMYHDVTFPDGSVHREFDEAKAAQYIRDTLSGKQEDAAIKQLNQRVNEAYGYETKEYYKMERVTAEMNAKENRRIADERHAIQDAERQEYAWVNAGKSPNEFRRQFPDVAAMADRGGSADRFMNAYAAILSGKDYAPVSQGGLLAKLTNPNQTPPTEFARTDITQYKSSLTESDYNTLSVRQAAAKSKVEDKEKSYFTVADSVMGRFAPTDFKWRTQATDDGMENARNDYRDKIYHEIQTRIDHDETLTSTDISEIARQVALSYHVTGDPSGLFNSVNSEVGSDTPILSEWTPEQRAAATVPLEDIPGSMVERIKKDIVKAGKDPTDQGLIEQLAGQLAIKQADPELEPEATHNYLTILEVGFGTR